jgi:hypothetical protein
MQNKKCQLSIEFLIITIIALLVFLLIVGLVFDKNRDMENYKVYLHAKEVNNLVATSIDEVYIAGDGSVKEIYIPPTLIRNTNYTTYIVENLVGIRWSGRHHTTPVVTSNITGSLSKGYNNISNLQGGIVIG